MVDCFAANKCYRCPPTFLLPMSPAAQRTETGRGLGAMASFGTRCNAPQAPPGGSVYLARRLSTRSPGARCDVG